MIDTILFDLDGTLLPFDQETFTTTYLEELAKTFVPRGYDPERLIESLWAGTRAMVQNDGERTNRERFWDCFTGLMGEQVRADEPAFDRFYAEEFNLTRRIVQDTGLASRLIAMLREKHYRLILATNPLFPSVGTVSRLSWVGLSPDDFAYISTYENSHYCKPNLDYYRELLERDNLCAEQCLMVGNSVDEDMCATELGCAVYLVTDHLENRAGRDVSAYPRGSLEDCMAHLAQLPAME